MSSKFLGQKFGRLLVVARLGEYARCLCDCGATSTPRMDKLTGGQTKSCGCLARENAERRRKPKPEPVPKPPKKKRSAEERRLRSVHSAMKSRCNNPKNQEYKRYGARGITVCPEWDSFENFYDWAKGLYRAGLWLERRDNDAGYSPENCTFASPKRQGRNRRNGLLVQYRSKGFKPVCLAQAAEKYGVPYMVAYGAYGKCLRAGHVPPIRIDDILANVPEKYRK